jgi:hypothetical protein
MVATAGRSGAAKPVADITEHAARALFAAPDYGGQTADQREQARTSRDPGRARRRGPVSPRCRRDVALEVEASE